MYQYPHVSQLFILLPWQSRVYPEPLKVVEFVQLTTECCWGQPSDPCQRGCLTSHACVMWGPRTLNADDDDDDRYIIFLCIDIMYNLLRHTIQRGALSPLIPSLLPHTSSELWSNCLTLVLQEFNLIYLFCIKHYNQCTIKILSVMAWIQELEGPYHLN